MNVICPPDNASALQRIVAQLSIDVVSAQALFTAAAQRSICVTFCNPLSVRIAAEFPEYLVDLQRFDRVYADGILLALLAGRWRGVNVPRLSFDGNSLAPEVFAVAAQKGVGVALLGGREGVAAAAAVTLQAEFGVRVVWHRHGYCATEADVASVIAGIRGSGAGLVIAGMGGGVQERMILRLRDSGWHGLAISCGGYLDQIAVGGRARYYPSWVNAWHLRALWRVLHEPGRLLPRYSVGYLPFYRAACRLLLARKRTP